MSCQSQTTGGRRSRKMRGGNGYGVGSPIAVGALEYVPNMTSVPNGAPYKPAGGRRRRSRRRGGAVTPPVKGDYVDDMGRKLVPQKECSEGGNWNVAPAGRLLIKDPLWGLIPYGIKNPNPTNKSGEPLGVCDGTPPNPLLGQQKFGARRTRRKSKGRRRRSMRGGGSVAGVGYGFAGAGSRGLADPTPYPSNLPVGGDFAIPTGTR